MSTLNSTMNWQAVGNGDHFSAASLAIGPDGTPYGLWQTDNPVQSGIDKWDETENRWTNIKLWDGALPPTERSMFIDNQTNIHVLLREVYPSRMVIYTGDSTGEWRPFDGDSPDRMVVTGQGNIYGIGRLDQEAYSPPCSPIYKYDSGWKRVGAFEYDKNIAVEMVIDSGDNIFALFLPTSSDSIAVSLDIYKYTAANSQWSRLGRIDNVPRDNDGGIHLATDKDGTILYVAGDFTEIISETGTAVQANGVAKWDSQNWSPVGEWTGAKYFLTMASGTDGRLYVGTRAIPGAAEWDGNNWRPLGLGGMVKSIVVDNAGTVYAAGGFPIFDQSGTWVGRDIAKSVPAGVTDTASSTQ